MKSGIALPVIVFSAFLFSAVTIASDSVLFPVPENLEDNVIFWKKIYTEISINEGVFHDSEYPDIIFQKLIKGDLTGKRLDNFLIKPKQKIVQAIKAVQEKEVSSWNKLSWNLASLYSRYPPEILKNAHKRVRFQQGQKERFVDGIRRSGAYMDTIRAILSSFGLPLELAFLPHVESSFNTEVYSKVGAAGLWQFMPYTGKAYLTINRHVDERLDPILSTFAAAKLMKRDYKVLKSWPLALTAYNHGLTGVLRAIEQTGSRDIGKIVKEYSSPSFRFASKNFYCCFIAAAHAADSADYYFGELQYQKPYKRKDLLLLQSMPVKQICSILGLTRKQFSTLNPSILSEMYKLGFQIPFGTIIHINHDVSAESLYKRVTFYYDSLPPEKSDYYVLKADDKIYNIAEKLATTPEVLLSYNEVKINELYAGQILANPRRVNSVPGALNPIVTEIIQVYKEDSHILGSFSLVDFRKNIPVPAIYRLDSINTDFYLNASSMESEREKETDLIKNR